MPGWVEVRAEELAKRVIVEWRGELTDAHVDVRTCPSGFVNDEGTPGWFYFLQGGNAIVRRTQVRKQFTTAVLEVWRTMPRTKPTHLSGVGLGALILTLL